MKICVVGTGYVGLVSGACFSEMGNNVVCIDVNFKKIDQLNQNIIPIYEPRLEELVRNNKEGGRLSFSTDIRKGVEGSEIIFIAVGTPTGEDGSADLQYVLAVAESIGKYINGYKVIVDKSTVPVGTSVLVRETVEKAQRERKTTWEFDVVSNPEFLKEGAAIDDFMRPDRVVIGSDNERATKKMQELYLPFTKNGHPVLIMDTRSAEITKYAANCMLALRISFMNDIARLCEKTGADVTQVRTGIGTDSRIGMPFLYAGLGYGGSCFPKDVKALIKSFKTIGEKSSLLEAVEEINQSQRELFIEKILKHFKNDVKGKTFAVWGLAFKPNTDDMREAPAATIIQKVVEKGAQIRAYDPQAVKEAKHVFGENNPSVIYTKNQYEPLEGADALLLITEWNCFKEPDFLKLT
ncbi:MAG: UDP-glucose/GDP-mannose dehydrogenase family protein, partial [Patescibacteria group bacterium]|nr:UDP-glucose/GDP-mannose dehydrogenase family protein [Patescibacteria group bacterium]